MNWAAPQLAIRCVAERFARHRAGPRRSLRESGVPPPKFPGFASLVTHALVAAHSGPEVALVAAGQPSHGQTRIRALFRRNPREIFAPKILRWRMYLMAASLLALATKLHALGRAGTRSVADA